MYENYGQLILKADKIENELLKRIVLEAFSSNEEELKIIWGGSGHHKYKGGFIDHTLGVTEIAEMLSRVYPEVNRDLLITGALLHDIGKIGDFVIVNGEVTGLSKGMHLEGHLYKGAVYVRGLCCRFGVDKETTTLLEHMILSHHGIRSWGAVSVPMTIEAFLLHKSDVIDIGMSMIRDSFEGVVEGEVSPVAVWGTKMYRPKEF